MSLPSPFHYASQPILGRQPSKSKVLEGTVPPSKELGAVHIDARVIVIKEYAGIESVSIEAYVERIRVWSCL